MFVGEAAGIQDLLWGSGMMTAIESGHLAAECIIQGCDYSEVAKSHFEDRLKATLDNRFLWEVVRFNNYAVVVDEPIQSRTNRSLNLSSLYRFGSMHRAVYPITR